MNAKMSKEKSVELIKLAKVLNEEKDLQGLKGILGSIYILFWDNDELAMETRDQIIDIAEELEHDLEEVAPYQELDDFRNELRDILNSWKEDIDYKEEQAIRFKGQGMEKEWYEFKAVENSTQSNISDLSNLLNNYKQY